MPKASADTARKLARLSTDCSFLLTHMIRQNGSPAKTDADARATILSYPRAFSCRNADPQGRPGGLVLRGRRRESHDPASGTFKTAAASRAVCFTDSTLAGLRAHRVVFDVKYGLAFDREWLFKQGAAPCLNIREDLLKGEVPLLAGEKFPRKVYNFIPENLHPFINIINESFDATHEREWRRSGDLEFSPADLRFIFCPEGDFATFSKLQYEGLPPLFDLDWLDRV